MIRWCVVVVALGVVLGAAGDMWAAEEKTVRAMASIQGQGRVFDAGPEQEWLLGSFSGVMFVEDAQGALDAGQIVCPGTVELDLRSGKQKAEGRCVITGSKGDRVYARWACEGVHTVGCKGKFTLTGGTGAAQGITGEGDFTIRSAGGESSRRSGAESVEELAAGLVVWPALHYRIP